MKRINPQNENGQQTTRRIKCKENHTKAHHRLLENSKNSNILKAAKGKQYIRYRETNIRMTVEFLILFS